MPRRPTTLVPVDPAAAAAAVERDERVRVVLGAGSGLPPNTRGRIVRVSDPAASAECVHVEVGGDVLPFAPAEVLVQANSGIAAAAPVPAAEPAPASSAAPAPAALPPAPAPAKSQQPRRSVRRTAPQRLSVTLRYESGRWTAEAAQGAKTVVRPTPVRPAAALEIAEALDLEPVRALVNGVVSDARSAALAQAEEARRRLAEAEAALAAFEPKPGRSRRS